MKWLFTGFLGFGLRLLVGGGGGWILRFFVY